MAGRQNKVNLDYFELDCHMDDNVKLVQAEYGLKGFAVFVKLLQKIYGERGYYCEWTPDQELLFASENGLNGGSLQLLRDIVSACIRRNLFSDKLYKEYGILTSSGVQKQYLKATAKREVVELKKEYLLITIPEKAENVTVNSINVGRNTNDSVINMQSRVKKSKKRNKNTMCKADASALFEELWKLYPVKKGKGKVSDAAKMRLLKIGYDEMERAINRYIAYVDSIDYLHYQNGSTFFNSGYVDYLDANYTPEKVKKAKTPKATSQFNQFPQNDYDFEQLEKEILSN